MNHLTKIKKLEAGSESVTPAKAVVQSQTSRSDSDGKTLDSRLRGNDTALSSMSSRGFTLVEMIVSLMIFSIVAVVALAALVKIIDANNKAQTIQAAVTSLSFSLDSMSRELRTGSNIHCMFHSDGTFDSSRFLPQIQAIVRWVQVADRI